jgi:hypothetical protein
MSIWSALAGSVATGLFNQRSANKQMRFQDVSSRTQYQRAVADMKAAGLNPMLATKLGGNAAMSGASASMPDLGATINSAQSIANQAKVQEAQVGKINQEIVNLGLESVAKGLDNMQKEMLVIFEKSLSPEAYKLYKMPMMKALAEGLKVPGVVAEIADSEAMQAVKTIGGALVNPIETLDNLFNWASDNGKSLAVKHGTDGFDSLIRAIKDVKDKLMRK